MMMMMMMVFWQVGLVSGLRPECRPAAVANMLELLNWCRNSSFHLEALRNALNVPRPTWNDIIIKVESAKLNDSFLRIWYSGPTCEKGLLFTCNGGIIQASEPRGGPSHLICV